MTTPATTTAGHIDRAARSTLCAHFGDAYVAGLPTTAAAVKLGEPAVDVLDLARMPAHPFLALVDWAGRFGVTEQITGRFVLSTAGEQCVSLAQR